MAAGYSHSLILKRDGSLWACGNNGNGELGDGTGGETGGVQSTPVETLRGGVLNMAAGHYHSLLLKSDSSLWGCGHNFYGQLGDGTTEDKITPIEIMKGVESFSASERFSLILKNDGSLWGCGVNEYGELGDGTFGRRNLPFRIIPK